MKIKFYLKSSGKSPVEEFIQDCAIELKADFFDALNLLASGKMISMPLSRNLASIHPGLHELRLKDRSGQIRVFYFIKKMMPFICFMLLRKRLKKYLKMKLN
jgi:hypothetical protein